MSATGILQAEGAPALKGYRHVPMSTQTFFSGLWTQRSPFNGPDNRYYQKVLGNRTDILIDGSNVELTNYGTIIRRPGTLLYSTAVLDKPPISFYSFHQVTNNGGSIFLIADTPTSVYSVNQTSATSILSKNALAGESFFQTVGSNLYIGDGVDLKVWPGTGSSRNWGIANASSNTSSGPNAPTAAANVVPGGGSISTATQGPNGAGTGAVSGAGRAWANPGNITSSDGQYATAQVFNATTSQELQATGFNFSIPTGSTIQGIVVEVQRGFLVNSSDPLSPGVQDNDVTLLKAGVATGSNKAIAGSWPASQGTGGDPFQSYGSSSDLWGAAWLVSDINNANFGVQLSIARVSGNLLSFGGVDFIRISVIYIPPTAAVPWSNPTNIEVSDGAFASVTVNNVLGVNQSSQYLQGTTFGFGTASGSVSGILVEVQGFGSFTGSQPQPVIAVQLLKGGNPVGTIKTAVSPVSNSFTSFGSPTDTWGAGFLSSDVNIAQFGIQIGQLIATSIPSTTDSQTLNIDFVRITVFISGGPVVTVSGAAGTFSAVTGYEYIFTWGNSSSSHVGNPTPPSSSTGAFTNKASVGVGLVASTDPQVNQIRVFRTKDGGSTFFELPSSPYPNTTQTIQDSATDASLQVLSFFSASQASAGALGNNAPPPAGLIKMTFHLQRIWGAVNNIVYYSAITGDITLGSPYESFPGANTFTFPETVHKLLPISGGLLVFTTDNIFIIVGTSPNTFYVEIFEQGIGILSPNAVDIQGSFIFVFTSDKTLQALNVSGANEIGFAIGDNLAQFDPTKVYVASLISGTQDKAVFISDGSTGWYRCNWNQPPEGGPSFSPFATITGGLTSVVSVETSPGIHQLLIGVPNKANPSQGSVAVRANINLNNKLLSANIVDTANISGFNQIVDTKPNLYFATGDQVLLTGLTTKTNLNNQTLTLNSASTGGGLTTLQSTFGASPYFPTGDTGTVTIVSDINFTDFGSPYPAFFTFGSLVLSQPGQIAEVNNIIIELPKLGSVPSVSVLLEEINGQFQTLANSVDDPPRLPASNSLISKRFYLNQNQQSVLTRHLQVKISFSSTDKIKNELYTMSIFGALRHTGY